MKVWVVESCVDYEGCSLEGIFDSEEKAKAYVKLRRSEKKKVKKDRAYQSAYSCWWDSIDYYEYEVS